MGITRDGQRKRLKTSGKHFPAHKKRKHALGRTPANTRLGPARIRRVRVRGGNYKLRALKLDVGNFSWPSQLSTHKTRIVGVVYNPVSNELVRTNTLTRGTIVQLDSIPFRQWYEQRYQTKISNRGTEKGVAPSSLQIENLTKVPTKHVLDPAIEIQLKRGKILAHVTSRPGQNGRADGYIIEGEELAFYTKKIAERKKK